MDRWLSQPLKRIVLTANRLRGVRSRLLGELSQPLGIPLRSSSGRDTVRYWQIVLQKSAVADGRSASW
jgi:hypothetical protein